MKNKRDWYDSLPLRYIDSIEVCPNCGFKCIETVGNTEEVIYACINNDCKVGFINSNKIKG